MGEIKGSEMTLKDVGGSIMTPKDAEDSEETTNKVLGSKVTPREVQDSQRELRF